MSRFLVELVGEGLRVTAHGTTVLVPATVTVAPPMMATGFPVAFLADGTRVVVRDYEDGQKEVCLVDAAHDTCLDHDVPVDLSSREAMTWWANAVSRYASM